MAETTELTISGLKIHGSGVASCGSYPDIKVSATIKFTRANPNDTTINWEVSSISWSHPTSGSYGFKFRCYLYLSIPGTYYELIMKNNTTASNWWKYTTLKKPSGSFTAGEGVTTISASIRMHGGSDSCTSGSDHHLCYGSSTYRNIKTYTVTLPTFAPYYTISYNNNGGVGTIESQIKEPEQDINLTTDIPSFPVTITYHDNPDRVETTERPFLNWLGSGTQYAPGALYTADASCEMVAQWGDASFTPVLPTKYVRITYSLDGGILDPSYIDIARASLGYDPDSTVTSNPQYPNATACTTTSATLSLYPIYGNATMLFANLPTPVKPGYRFEGWFFDSILQTPVESDISTAVDMTLYASWTFIPVRKFENNNWQEDDLYVWIFNGTAWQKIAPIYAFNGTSWANMSGGPAPVEVTTAKAGIANFTTSLARPLVNLTSYFKATQEAGTPTPQSPKAITGVSAVSVFHTGANVWDEQWNSGTWDIETGLFVYGSNRVCSKDLICVKPLTQYFFKTPSAGIWVLEYDENKNYKGVYRFANNRTLTTKEGTHYITFYVVGGYPIYENDISINYLPTETEYHAYNGSTTIINLGGTYYGGYITQDKDGKRELVVTHGIYAFDGTENFGALSSNNRVYTNILSDAYIPSVSTEMCVISTHYVGTSQNQAESGTVYKTTGNLALVFQDDVNGVDVATFKAFLANQYANNKPVTVVYKIATPYTIDLPDGEPITAFNGVNNIYNNSSDSQVTFLATPEEAEAAQQRSLSKGNPSEESEEEEKPEEEPIEEPKDTGNER